MTIQPMQLAYLPQKDETALLDWAGSHSQWHNRVQQEAVKQNKLDVGTFDVADMVDMDGWLFWHNEEHQKIASAFNISGAPDLTYWDKDDPINWNNWLMAHSLVHDAERKTLNL
jgi:hypothetical protein